MIISADSGSANFAKLAWGALGLVQPGTYVPSSHLTPRCTWDDWEDYARDEFISELYSDFANDVLAGRDDLYGEVINKFTSERLTSFYLQNPDIAQPAIWALGEAQALLPNHPSAALVFGAAATEVALKATLLKPILHGLIHDEALAGFVVELVPEQRNDKFKSILFAILNEFGGIDLRSFKRVGASQKLWDEIGKLHAVRNDIVHRAEKADTAGAEHAIEVATTLLHEVFPAVLTKLGQHVHEQLTVCGERHS